MNKTLPHQPKGGQCQTCTKRFDDCSGLDFSAMRPIKAFEDCVVVRCSEHCKDAEAVFSSKDKQTHQLYKARTEQCAVCARRGELCTALFDMRQMPVIGTEKSGHMTVNYIKCEVAL